jgi:hypothetical protein
MYRIGLVVVMLLGCSSDSDPHLGRADCEHLRDHLIEVRLEASAESGHRDAMRRALGEDFVQRCVADVSREQLACAMNATDRDKLRTCISER